jgi:hypothetical protein
MMAFGFVLYFADVTNYQVVAALCGSHQPLVCWDDGLWFRVVLCRFLDVCFSFV